MRHVILTKAGIGAIYVLVASPMCVPAWAQQTTPPVETRRYIGPSAEERRRGQLNFNLLKQGEAALKAVQIEEAIRSFREAAELLPRETPAYYGLARAYLAQNQLGKASEMFRKALPFEPRPAEVALRFDNDLPAYIKAAYDHGDLHAGGLPEATLAAQYALLLNQMGKPEEAVAMYHRALRRLNGGNHETREPVPLTLVFGTDEQAGETPYSSAMLEAAANLVLAIEDPWPFTNETPLQFAEKAVAAAPAWGLAHFYRAFIPGFRQTQRAKIEAKKAGLREAIRLAGKDDAVLKAVATELLEGDEFKTKAKPFDVRKQLATLERARLKLVKQAVKEATEKARAAEQTAEAQGTNNTNKANGTKPFVPNAGNP